MERRDRRAWIGSPGIPGAGEGGARPPILAVHPAGQSPKGAPARALQPPRYAAFFLAALLTREVLPKRSVGALLIRGTGAGCSNDGFLVHNSLWICDAILAVYSRYWALARQAARGPLLSLCQAL